MVDQDLWDEAQRQVLTESAGTDQLGGGKTPAEKVRMRSDPEQVRSALGQLERERLSPGELRGAEYAESVLVRYDELRSPAIPQQEEEHSPVLDMEVVKDTPDISRERAIDMAAAITTGLDDVDAFRAVRQEIAGTANVRAATQAAAAASAAEKDAEVTSYTAQLIREARNAEELEDAVNLSFAVREYKRQRTEGLEVESEFLEAVANFEEITSDDIEMEAVNLRILSEVEELAESIGVGRMLWDFANILFVPGDIVEDTEDLVGIANLFNGREELQKAVLAFYTLSDAREKLAYWERLKELATSKLNKSEAASLLAAFATGDVAGRFEEYGAVSVGESITSLVPILGTGARALRSLGTTARVAYSLNNYRAAARMAADGVKARSDAAAKQAGVAGRKDAADAASPINIRGIADNDMTGLAPLVQRNLQEEAAVMRNMLNSMVEGRAVVTPGAALRTTDERALAEMSLWNQGRNIVRNTKGDVVEVQILRAHHADVNPAAVGLGADEALVTIKIVPKGAVDPTPPTLRQLKSSPRRTEAQRRAVAELDGEAARVKSQKITPERRAEKLANLMNKKTLRENLATLAVNSARTNTAVWPQVMRALERGRWADAARIIRSMEKGPTKSWGDLRTNPLLDATLRKQLKALWKDSRGYEPQEPAAQFITHHIKARMSDYVGTWTQESLPSGSWFLSNRASSRTPDTIESYNAAGVLDNVSSRVYNLLSGIINETYSSLNKQVTVRGKRIGVPFTNNTRKQRVANALEKGDEFVDPATGEEIGRVFTPEELRRQFGLDDQEMEAYYKLRMVFDHLHVLKNDAARRELMALGYRDVRMRSKIKYKDKDGTEQSLEIHDVGRPYDSADVAWREAEGNGISEVFSFGTQSSIQYSRELIKDGYERGMQLVRLRNPFKDPRTGKRHQFVLANVSSEISDLPNEVLAYKTGYVPRVYDRGVWFVKAFPREATIDGRRVDDRAPGGTQGMADNRAAAVRLSENLNMDGDGSVTYRVVAADQMDPIELMTAAPTGGGRLYVSGRGDRPIPFYKLVDGQLVDEKASRIDPLEALQGNISNIAYHYPRNEWRIANALRLENTAKKLGVKYNGLHADAQDAGGGPKATAFVNRQRSQLRDWLSAPDDSEVWWNNTLQNLYEGALGKEWANGVVAQGIWWMKSKNPITAVRGATFHLMLGMLNPVQTFVQAQGAAVALSMNLFRPAEMSRVFKMQSALSILSNLEDNMLAAAARELRRSKMITGVEADEMYMLANAYRRSGLQDGVLTNADFSAMEQGFGQVLNVAARTADKALYFYRIGELFNRRLSFTTAFREFLDNNPQVRRQLENQAQARALYGGRKGEADFTLSNEDVIKITARANDFMLNLGRANRATWQKGVLSVPTQFWQVQAKLLEELLLGGLMTDKPGAVFTRKERMKLMLGQIGLYGAAGMPVAGPYLSYQLDYNKSGVAADPDSLLNRTFDEGLYGAIFATLGADVDVSKRGAILNDLQDLVYDYLLGDKTTAEAMTGAFNSIAGRTMDAWKRLYPLRLSTIDTEVPITREDFMVAADAIGDLATSWSNLTKAYTMMMYDQSFSRSGNLLATEDFNPQTVLMTAMGFMPRSDSKAYDLLTLDRMYTQTKADTKRSIRKLMLDYLAAANANGGNVDERLAKKLEKTAWVMMHYIRPDERIQMLEEIRKEIVTGESMLAKATNRFVRINMEAYVDDAFNFFQKSVIGQVGMSEEDIK
jgi:hypothetical protein